MTAPPRLPAGRRRTTALLTIAVPTLLVAGAAGLTLTWRAQLPDPVAIHWGPGGADGFASLEVFAGLTVVGVVAMSGLMYALTVLLGGQAVTRRVLHAAAVWSGAFLAGVLITTVSAQRGLADASAAEPGDAAMAWALVTATVLAGLVAALTPGDESRPAAGPVPGDAPRVALGAGEHAVWVREVGRRTAVPAAAAALVFAVVIGAISGLWWFAGVLGVVLAALLVTVLRWTVTVDATGLTARSLLRRPSLRVPIDEVEHAAVVEVDPLREFGGWGLRIGRDGRTGVVLRRGTAIEVHRGGGAVVVVTAPDAATGAALLNTFAARRGAGATPAP
ncbi:DUF1648 domain-containing protein [Actinotalea ferrariae]|uniref:DUF1648 domain-containing protein n=1 Tax=Actinotalea ferrariae TaxID=1386098 RepID=UPI001C8B875C|nr:DUF1648 domain-containing protein [Actinotalea ferrariae]MBX9244209.1 DUF1648 domain-containing protein [Actinotalea ferrariae]